MKYGAMFHVAWQDALSDKSRSFVWFLISLINPFILLIYWTGLVGDSNLHLSSIQLSSISSYYLLLVIASSLILAHAEEVVAYEDIQKGGLSRYITKPLSYFWYRFISELPWRIIQGFFGVIVFVIIHYVFRVSITFVHSIEMTVLSVICIIIALLLTFVFKMILGLSALWTTDFSGLAEFVNVVLLIFGGFILPLHLFPKYLEVISVYLPFASMFYFPIMAVSNSLTLQMMYVVLIRQTMWLIFFSIIYKVIWKHGTKRFTGVGM